jgi:hypothetical protein
MYRQLFGHNTKNELFLPLLKIDLSKVKNYMDTFLKMDLIILAEKDTNIDYFIKNQYYKYHVDEKIADKEYIKIYFNIPDEILTDMGYILTNNYKNVSAITKNEIKTMQPQHFNYYFKASL